MLIYIYFYETFEKINSDLELKENNFFFTIFAKET